MRVPGGNFDDVRFDAVFEELGEISARLRSALGEIADELEYVMKRLDISVSDSDFRDKAVSVGAEPDMTFSWMEGYIRSMSAGFEAGHEMMKRAAELSMSEVSFDAVISRGGDIPEMRRRRDDDAGNRDDLIADIAAAVRGAVSADSAGGDAASSGDIVIPVYIGADMVDEVIISAQQRMDLRSGGR